MAPLPKIPTLDGRTLAGQTLDGGTLDAGSTGAGGVLAGQPGLWVIFSPLAGVEHRTVRLGGAPLALNRLTELDGGIPLGYARISQVHAEVRPAADGFEIADLGSRNGTFVNGVRIAAPTTLAAGDVVEVGGTFLQLVDDVVACSASEPDDGVRAELVGPSPQLTTLRTKIRQIGPASINVLVHGPSGAGKERAAQALHVASGRSGPLVSLNCAVLSEELAASELFGHVKGAFTGAAAPRPGAFRKAQGGTLFLDEIGELPLALQAKLLRALQEQRIRPVGSDEELGVDVRVVAATNRHLPTLVAAERFRGDLYSRIATATLSLPPLRERPADVVALAHHFLGRRLHRDAVRELLLHDWPYNVRDLRAIVTLLQTSGEPRGPVRLNDAARDKLAEESAPAASGAHVALSFPSPASSPSSPLPSAPDATTIGDDAPASEPTIPWPDDGQARKALLAELLAEHRGNLMQIGRLLGKAPRSLRRWLKQYGLDADSYR